MNNELNNYNIQSNNGVVNNQQLNTNKIIGYNPQTGDPIYATSSINNNLQIVGYNPQTGAPIYGINNINNQNQVQSVRYATLGERFGAILRDFLQIWWFSSLGFFLIFILRLVLNINGMNESSFYTILGQLQVAGPILFIIYGQPIYALFADASNKHATKGKLKRNMYVLNKKGNYLTFGESFLRMLLKYVTLCIPFGLIATIIVTCCTEKKQLLHDLILGHVVVRKN